MEQKSIFFIIIFFFFENGALKIAFNLSEVLHIIRKQKL
jgi:hypothetical protein